MLERRDSASQATRPTEGSSRGAQLLSLRDSEGHRNDGQLARSIGGGNHANGAHSSRKVLPVTYAFGQVRVDADARIISSTVGSVHLTRKAFDLLLLLLENRPSVVTKEQIYARVWPNTFVADSSLQFVVHEIRQAIDDSAGRQSWIRTVHGIGYNFCGDVLVRDLTSVASALEHPAAWLLGASIRVALRAGENIVGRGIDDVIEIEAPTISRRHARITIGESTTLEDLGSKNGTWLKDERLTAPHALADGDVVRLGSARFTFRVARQPKPTESVDDPLDDAGLTAR
jgi:DNA-binding winged helix-turn-helix (wHTH) protein